MRKKSVFKRSGALFLTLCMTLFGCSNPSFPDSGRHYNMEEGFSLLLPNSWQTGNNEMNTAMASVSPPEGPDDRFQENVSVVIQDVAQGTTLDQQFKEALESFRKGIPGFSEQESGTAFIGRAKAKWMVYSFWVESTNIQIMAYLLMRDNKLYVISCAAIQDKFAQYKDRFLNIVKSFRFEK